MRPLRPRPTSANSPAGAAVRATLAVTWALLAGCAGGPAAYDKAILAKPEMTMSWNPLAAKFDQHLYESKEAASGGYGVGGGGCGCY